MVQQRNHIKYHELSKTRNQEKQRAAWQLGVPVKPNNKAMGDCESTKNAGFKKSISQNIPRKPRHR